MATMFEKHGIYFAKNIREPVDGEYYRPAGNAGSITDHGKKYHLWVWRETRQQVQKLAEAMKYRYPWIRYATRVIIFCRNPRSKYSPAKAMYGLYLRKED